MLPTTHNSRSSRAFLISSVFSSGVSMVTTVLSCDIDSDVGRWVDAAPFRAHLRHLMAVGGMSSAAVAVLAGISPRATFRLLHGRGGRALRRISPDTARRLLQVTPEVAATVRSTMVPAATTRHHLGVLCAAGWSEAELARRLGLPQATLVALINGTVGRCTQLAALRAAVEVSKLSTAPPAELPVARAAA